METGVFAEMVINVAAPLQGTFHYHVPSDLATILQPGHLAEVEFGQQLAQGIVLRLSADSPVADTKPIISLIQDEPVLRPWQLALGEWLSRYYLTPLNSCLRLMLPPGLTRWADSTVEINPEWQGAGRLTELQRQIVDLLEENGDMRGRQIEQALKKQADGKGPTRSKWQAAVNDLARRKILLKGTILDPPRVRPKQIRNASLIAGPKRILALAGELGRTNKLADVLHFLAQGGDPLPSQLTVLEATGASTAHLEKLAEANLITLREEETILVPSDHGEAPEAVKGYLLRLPATRAQLGETLAAELVAGGFARPIREPATVSLAISPNRALKEIFRLRNGETYLAILNKLAEAAQPVAVSELYTETDATLNHLRKLAGLDLIRLGAEEVWRDPLADRDFVPSYPPTLTVDQTRVWEAIQATLLEMERNPALTSRPVLLHGVTGSGKTEIYMRAIDYALARGQRAIVLVPEIAITPQTVRRFAARFPGRVAVLHSRLSDGERYDTWRRARMGLFDIVIGPRSALFTPLENLVVIIIDEEHDQSYKQSPPVTPPYYHVRDTAIALAEQTGALVIMGSATPDLVTYHQARGGRFQLLELSRRVMGHRDRIAAQATRLERTPGYRQAEGDPQEALSIPLPPVQIIDLRQELRAGNRSVFSRSLQAAMLEVLERNEQAILFLNRRGTNTFVLCRDCGHVLLCPRCDIPLTFHRPQESLVCHQCGRRERQPEQCPECRSRRIRYFGLGTEELEDLVRQQWPAARVVRWDRDTTAGKDSHEQILASFVNQEADILIGTQMIAKGLDLPLVTLVGVVLADVSLGLPDMHSGERTFQVLTQVAGRAGRGLLGGRVILQTYKPEHYAIQAAAEHDFDSFYLEEIRFRTRHQLPPFRRQVRLLLEATGSASGRRAAEELGQGLRRHVQELALGATEILGPTPPFFGRIGGRYRWQIIIRTPDPARVLADFPIPRPWQVDIDPVTLL